MFSSKFLKSSKILEFSTVQSDDRNNFLLLFFVGQINSQLFITIGILAASIIGNLTGYKVFAIVCAVPSFLMSILMVFMPESPVQIISKGPLNEKTINRARNELKRLRSPNSTIESELDLIVSSQKAMNNLGGEKFTDKICKVDFYKPLIYSLVLMLIQQMSGRLI